MPNKQINPRGLNSILGAGISDLEYYYQCTNHSLSLINIATIPDCDLNYCHGSHFDAINMYYENIVAALHCASSSVIH